MNSLKNEFEITEQEAQAVIEYIEEQIQLYSDEVYNIMCVELYNGEKIICMYNFEEPEILYMPVHLVENVDSDEYTYRLSYVLYAYHNLASDCSELILDESPKIMFAPKTRLLLRYMDYWNVIKDAYQRALNTAAAEEAESEENPLAYIQPVTNKIS